MYVLSLPLTMIWVFNSLFESQPMLILSQKFYPISVTGFSKISHISNGVHSYCKTGRFYYDVGFFSFLNNLRLIRVSKGMLGILIIDVLIICI
jgi:hypothetical protein